MNAFNMISPCKYPTVIFGQYYITNEVKPFTVLVKSQIEWMILDIDSQNKQALLLSKYVLDWQNYSYWVCNGDAMWNTSSIRKWLNNEFYNDCFDENEKSSILETFVSCDNGRINKDKIFILSEQQIKKYLPSPELAKAYEPTVYQHFFDDDAPIELFFSGCIWWTRTKGNTHNTIKCVDFNGELSEQESSSDEIGIRPAMWVKFEI